LRARVPDRTGILDRDGVDIGWELFEPPDAGAAPSVFLLPTWAIVHARFWKAQVPDLARRYRVLTMDNRGNGRSGRPPDTEAYRIDQEVADLVAVMDATDTPKAVLVGFSMGATYAVHLAARHPERVTGLVLIGPYVPGFGEHSPEDDEDGFDVVRDRYEDWQQYNRHMWQRDWPTFVEWFMRQVQSEPHSTKQIEDMVDWALETDGPTITRTEDALAGSEALGPRTRDLLRGLDVPSLVIQGTHDRVVDVAAGRGIATALGAHLLLMDEVGHAPVSRQPVRVNLAIREFVDRVTRPTANPTMRTWRRASSRPRRVLFVSSPIGLGHAQRDIAIARAIRRQLPDVRIDWLAQDPVTRVLAAATESIHPASALLASESRHIESESAEHDLHCFGAFRRMDEILVANFMVFLDVVRSEEYDLWVGDEAWEVDHLLHENPELKTAAYAWLTDFVGWLPMPEGGAAEAAITADYNAEMIEHIARYPRIRDRALFVGEPPDVIPAAFGPGLPAIPDWTDANFEFPGYILPFGPGAFADREAIRADLGYRPDERVVIATVGGTSVGTSLLRRVIAAYPEARRHAPDMRMVVVCGPRIDPGSIDAPDGLELRPYVHDLYRHLAVCDLAIVQGGLSTTMELAANGVPFICVPLRRHFEQQLHVRHRLGRHRAGRYLDYDSAADPQCLADAIVAELGRTTDYLDIAPGAADRAGAALVELLRG
jgi:pimeloyl-ACP methyl ester carboxylesterase/predicted glycosyltransferase